MTCKKAEEDADCSIVNSALALFPTHMSVVVICEDIDIFVILIGICTFDNVLFRKPGKGKIVQKIFSLHTALEKTIADNILFIDSMSGRGTTSEVLFNYGKMKFVQTLRNNPDLFKLIEFERGRVVGLREYGFSFGNIAESLGRNVSTVHDCWQQWSKEGTASRRPGSGQPRGTTEKKDRRLRWRIVLRLWQKFELQLTPQ
ncbi:hypothetical protein AVEN_83881-1 [Araneus ventricosus]|uniref:Uncharacterized protein n=1 Tax=Araneus ventricosus TaxID=182803 RepID=A0A4Y2FYK7_ARAVE|nr:hypothetical protein AVEN_83881-1 [Araneus ventricosus]